MTQYEKIENEFGTTIKRTTDDGVISFIPVDEANADYQAYLNKDKPQVEHLTEIPPQAALSTPIATLASELSNPSTPQAGE